MSGVLIIGAGGHGKVVADILMCSGIQVLGFLDDDPATWPNSDESDSSQARGRAERAYRPPLGLPVLGAIEEYQRFAPDGLAMGIGSNAARRQIVARLSGAESLWRNAIHPRAIVSPFARLGKGIVVAAGSVVNPDAVIGDFAILNTGATVDHDCVIGDYAHIAAGAHLSGNVRVGEGTLIGIGAAIAPGCSAGDWSVVGAGAAVVHDVPAGVTAKGVPARW
jgi:sugar O-acyltransferase (sialic acid O-acetyltransferase NeuD family)